MHILYIDKKEVKYMAKGFWGSFMSMLGMSEKKQSTARKTVRKASRPAAKKVVKKAAAKKVVKKSAKASRPAKRKKR